MYEYTSFNLCIFKLKNKTVLFISLFGNGIYNPWTSDTFSSFDSVTLNNRRPVQYFSDAYTKWNIKLLTICNYMFYKGRQTPVSILSVTHNSIGKRNTWKFDIQQLYTQTHLQLSEQIKRQKCKRMFSLYVVDSVDCKHQTAIRNCLKWSR